MKHLKDLNHLRQAWNKTRNEHGPLMAEWDQMLNESRNFIVQFIAALPEPEPELEATGQPHDFWTINSAIIKASEEYPQLRGLEVVPVAAILSYLPDPEPDGEWEQYDVRSVRKGDRVRWTVPGSEDNESYEIVVAAVTNEDGVVLDSESHSYYFPYGSVVDRIPAPVQHPDPEDHPVIIIYRPNGNGKSPVSYAWTGKHYRSFDGQEYFSVREITDWSPAKVVADDA